MLAGLDGDFQRKRFGQVGAGGGELLLATPAARGWCAGGFGGGTSSGHAQRKRF